MYARDDRVRLPIYIYRIRIDITIQYCSNPKTFDKSVSKFLVYPFGVATFTYDYGSKPCYPGVHPCQLNMRYPKI